jgi:hypothetical protein
MVLISVVLAALMEDADLDRARLHDPDAAFRNLAFAANQDIDHAGTYILYCNIYSIICPWSTMTRIGRAGRRPAPALRAIAAGEALGSSIGGMR